MDRVGPSVEGGSNFLADKAKGTDNHDRNQGGDEAVFDGGNAIVARQQPLDGVSHIKVHNLSLQESGTKREA
jgi:hypothetical protein